MDRDEPTIPEALRRDLLHARHVASDSAHDVVVSALASPHDHVRVLALRAGAAHDWLYAPDWERATSDASAQVRREVALLLARHRDVLRGDERLLTLLGDEDPLVVDAAAFALGEWESASAVDQLIAVATSHDDARCRESAVAALGAIGDPRSAETVIAALNDKPPVRRRAVVALTNFEGPEIDAALDAAREDRDWQVRAAIDQLDRDD